MATNENDKAHEDFRFFIKKDASPLDQTVIVDDKMMLGYVCVDFG
jgi:hypothetical protein